MVKQSCRADIGNYLQACQRSWWRHALVQHGGKSGLHQRRLDEPPWFEARTGVPDDANRHTSAWQVSPTSTDRDHSSVACQSVTGRRPRRNRNVASCRFEFEVAMYSNNKQANCILFKLPNGMNIHTSSTDGTETRSAEAHMRTIMEPPLYNALVGVFFRSHPLATRGDIAFCNL